MATSSAIAVNAVKPGSSGGSSSGMYYIPFFDESKNIYKNHILSVDLNSPKFRVIFTDFKDSSKDVVIEA